MQNYEGDTSTRLKIKCLVIVMSVQKMINCFMSWQNYNNLGCYINNAVYINAPGDCGQWPVKLKKSSHEDTDSSIVSQTQFSHKITMSICWSTWSHRYHHHHHQLKWTVINGETEPWSTRGYRVLRKYHHHSGVARNRTHASVTSIIRKSQMDNYFIINKELRTDNVILSRLNYKYCKY